MLEIDNTTNTKIASRINYDDLKEPGAYNAIDINYNGPMNAVGECTLIVKKNADNWIMQECKDSLDQTFLRSLHSSKWSNWTSINMNTFNQTYEKKIQMLEEAIKNINIALEEHLENIESI